MNKKGASFMIRAAGTIDGIYIFHQSEGSEEVIAIIKPDEVRRIIKELTEALFVHAEITRDKETK